MGGILTQVRRYIRVGTCIYVIQHDTIEHYRIYCTCIYIYIYVHTYILENHPYFPFQRLSSCIRMSSCIHTTPHHTTPHLTPPHHTPPHPTTPHHTTPHHTTPHHTTPTHTTPHHTTPHQTPPHLTTPHPTSPHPTSHTCTTHTQVKYLGWLAINSDFPRTLYNMLGTGGVGVHQLC